MNDDVSSERLTGDGLLADAGALHARLAGLLASGRGVVLDLSGVGTADVSFVQLIVSASLTADRNGQALTLTGVPPKLRVVFEQAGVGFDPAAGRITRN